MSNTKNGRSCKGSKHQMQNIVFEENQYILNEILSDRLEWLSPIKKDNYREYQLNNADIIKKLGLEKGIFKDFWPSRQPQWDGIAISEKGTLYLLEAKSHLSEIQPSNSEKQNLIRKSIDEVAERVSGITLDNDSKQEAWYHKYYQIANRIVFKEKMQDLISEIPGVKFNEVVLIFLNFVNDSTWSIKEMVTSEKDWISHYDRIFSEMGLDRNALSKRNIHVKCIDLSHYQMRKC